MNWEERPAKAYARHWLLNHLEIKRPINYLGLPAGTAIFEKMLCQTFEVKAMTLIEKDPNIFSELDEVLKDNVFKNISIESVCDDINDQSFMGKDFIWLDYCGPVTPKNLVAMKRGLRAIPDDGLLAVTFMAGREKASATTLLDFFDESSEIDLTEFVGKAIPNYFLRRVKAISEVALGVEPHLKIMVQPYSDVVPMVLFLFQKTDKRSSIEIEEYYKE